MEVRTNKITHENRRIKGYGIVFNHESRDLGGFKEIILPQAVTRELINASDIKVYLEHNPERGILARSNNGTGSLNIEIDEKGVIYDFEAPNTSLGDEVLEGLNRGDYNESSFAFVVKDEEWIKREDGTYLRYIKAIESLHDFSIVANGAYSDTYVSVAKRSLENFINEEKRSEMEQQELLDKIAALEATIEELRKKPEEPANVDNANTIDEEVRSLQNKIEDLEAQLETSKEETRNNNTNLNKTKEMTKFSLLRAINDIANGRQLDERAVEVVNAGREEMRKAGQSYAGQIVLPVEERAGYIQATVATAGQEIVAEDKLNILEGLRAKSVLAAAGATYMTGLTGNVSIPKYSNSQVGWEGEVNPAQDGKGEFSDVKFAPKRLTAYLDISKQFLAQDSVAAEEMLKRDIVNAITDKLEATILGGDAASTTQPAGLMNGASAVTVNHANIVGLEQTLEDNNVSGDLKMIVSPAIKAKLKTTALDSGSGRFLMEGNECNGYQVLSTTNCKGLIMGRFEDLVIAQWGA